MQRQKKTSRKETWFGIEERQSVKSLRHIKMKENDTTPSNLQMAKSDRQRKRTSHIRKEEDPDAPGGKTYEIVAKLMRDQGLQGDPKEFIPGYYIEGD